MSLENEVRLEIRKTKIQKAILTTIGVAGVLAVATVAPNTLAVLGKAFDKYSKRYIGSTTNRLIAKGLIAYETKDGKKFLRLTSRGLSYIGGHSLEVRKPRRWDKKWRIVTFDIAQQRSKQRALLRHTLVRIGFQRLQDSVWVFPYDCEELIVLLKTDFRLGKEVIYIIADRIENDRTLRESFGLGDE